MRRVIMRSITQEGAAGNLACEIHAVIAFNEGERGAETDASDEATTGGDSSADDERPSGD